MPITADYEERVYAGVLGKIIGVYLGRPFEGWDYDGILRKYGEIQYYVHEQAGTPLVVTDDDISGTFTFLRALEDYGSGHEITAEQIGNTWLNYLIEKRTVLWWGGMGNSTEHTAYLRLKHGIPAPRSGSVETNGRVVAEQIGAQIFIDGWGMVSPGDPERAATLAGRAASVSHDGEAIYGAQVVAALVAAAFVESDIDRMLDCAVRLIPRDSTISRVISDLREWHAAEPDWRKTREKIVNRYGYDRYGGNCHMVPNHALIIHALLHGDGDFQKSLMIVNTSGWDTDCNSGNVGCILGVRGGLAEIDSGPDYRGPVADRLYLPTADGGRCISDALTEAGRITSMGRRLGGLPATQAKEGARFHFSQPGSVQCFVTDSRPELRGTLTLENVEGHSAAGSRSLALHYHGVTRGRPASATTATFLPPETLTMAGYGIIASPTLYPGQTVEARISADTSNAGPVDVRLFIEAYNADKRLTGLYRDPAPLCPGEDRVLAWTIPDCGGQPVVTVGVEIRSDARADGTLYLDYLTWTGTPSVTFEQVDGEMWKRAWTDGVDHFEAWNRAEGFRIIQDEGTGLLIQGCREWEDYTVTADCCPHMAQSAGLAARVQGMRRYYGLLLCSDGKLRLVKALDGINTLAEIDFPWEFGSKHDLSITVTGSRIRASVGGTQVFDVTDTTHPLTGGGIALVCTEGRTATKSVCIEPA